jgi:hypothetical protein
MTVEVVLASADVIVVRMAGVWQLAMVTMPIITID